MMELDEQCREAGITVMNEIGLDPGLDHLCKFLCSGLKQTDAYQK
jgi:saccharopine dehydrogenase-like NADP-dependent oxidoreductase